MDHEEMRAAYLRALNYQPKTQFFNTFCNTCKLDYQNETGEIIDVVTLDSIYKVWYCDECLSRESEYV
jgi:hypothetical protein